MVKKRILIEGVLVASVAAFFQLIPVFFSEVFVLLTIFSTLPIYIITRKSVEVGITSYFACGLIVFCFSVHESIIFMFLNGLIGVSLGYLNSIINSKVLISCIISVKLFIAIMFVRFIIGIKVLPIKLNLFYLIGVMVFSFTYILLYSVFIKFLGIKVKAFKKYIFEHIAN